MTTQTTDRLITICGPTCSGKTTLAQYVMRKGLFMEAVSTTTRTMRAGEVDGVDYNFVSHMEFAERQAADDFVEVNQFGSNWYGVEKQAVLAVLELGATPILVIEPVGALNVRRFCSEQGIGVVSAFIDCNLDTAIDRLTERYCGDREKVASAAEIYADRLLKAAFMEPEWRRCMKYDLVFSGSSNEADLDAMAGALQVAAASNLSSPDIPLSVMRAMQAAMDSRENPLYSEVFQLLAQSQNEAPAKIAEHIKEIISANAAHNDKVQAGLRF